MDFLAAVERIGPWIDWGFIGFAAGTIIGCWLVWMADRSIDRIWKDGN